MAQIQRFFSYRHLRSEPTSHVLYFRRGRLRRSGRGLAFWFHPLAASIAEVPVDDREQAFLFSGRSEDFQDVSVQGTITYRVKDPETLAGRIDFGINPKLGVHNRQPLEQLAGLVAQLAQQYALDYIVHTPLRIALQEGIEQIRARIVQGMGANDELARMGIEVVAVRLAGVAPTAEVEKALQTPTREAIQQKSDQATFKRRALAVEKERAIAENELQNRIELARREQALIDQEGMNERRKATEHAEAQRIEAEAEAERARLSSSGQADSIRLVEAARNQAEREKMDVYRDLPSAVMIGLAAQQLAANLQSIEHLNLSPDALAPLLTSWLTAGTRKLEEDT